MKFLRPHSDHPVRRAYRRFRLEILLPRRLQSSRKARLLLTTPVIAITGSSGKSTTAALLSRILSEKSKVKSQIYFNSPDAVRKTFLRGESNQKFTILELGINYPGDMAKMAPVVCPDLAIVTLVGIEHYSSFRSREAIAEEKGILVESLRPGGTALLNGDDQHVMAMAERTTARIVTFGRGEHCDYRIISASASFPERMSMNVSCSHGNFLIKTRFTGSYFSLPTVAAFAAAVELGSAPTDAVESIACFEPPFNRCSVIEIPDGPTFILDAMKAPWESLALPFETIRNSKARKRRIVLGQIADFPGNPVSKYRSAVLHAKAVADEVILVTESKSITKSLKVESAQGGLVIAGSAREAFERIKSNTSAGEIILLKSSKNLHLERIAFAFREEVRCWENLCGLPESCEECGLYGIPFEDHSKARKKRSRDRFLGKLFGETTG